MPIARPSSLVGFLLALAALTAPAAQAARQSAPSPAMDVEARLDRITRALQDQIDPNPLQDEADPDMLRQFPSGQLTAGFINGRYRGAYRGPAGRAFANSRGYYGGNRGFINGGGGYRGGGFVNRPYGRSFVNW